MSLSLSSPLAKMRTGSQSNHFITEFYPEWSQGRTSFGGFTAAQALQALRLSCESQLPLRSMMINFISATGPGDIDIHCEELHRGKNSSWAEARVSQAGKLIATVTVFFGKSRDSAISVLAPERPDAPPPEQAVEVMGDNNPLAPIFTRNYQMRFAIGGGPVSAAADSEQGVWVRYRNSEEPLGEAQLVAILDLPPPAVMQMFTEPKPISSISWHIEFLDHLDDPHSEAYQGWWFMHSSAKACADGYSQEHSTLFTPSGRAIAMSQQTVAVYA